MNAIIKNIYILIKNNKVLICENNVKNLYDLLPEEIKQYKSYAYFNREFKKSDYFPLKWNKEYIFQKIDYTTPK